jgi:uncharacterized membrane protein
MRKQRGKLTIGACLLTLVGVILGVIIGAISGAITGCILGILVSLMTARSRGGPTTYQEAIPCLLIIVAVSALVGAFIGGFLARVITKKLIRYWT